MKRLLTIMLVALMIPLSSSAAELPSKVARVIKEAGIPLYGNMEYINGSLEVGVRFASHDPVGKVRKFYQDTFPNWALNNDYGSWILYDGKPGGGPASYVGVKQVMIQTNRKLPGWFGLPRDMTTEIVIVVPDSHE